MTSRAADHIPSSRASGLPNYGDDLLFRTGPCPGKPGADNAFSYNAPRCHHSGSSSCDRASASIVPCSNGASCIPREVLSVSPCGGRGALPLDQGSSASVYGRDESRRFGCHRQRAAKRRSESKASRRAGRWAALRSLRSVIVLALRALGVVVVRPPGRRPKGDSRGTCHATFDRYAPRRRTPCIPPSIFCCP
jgi:hypothetical protein